MNALKGTEATLGGVTIPVEASWFGLLVLGTLAWLGLTARRDSMSAHPDRRTCGKRAAERAFEKRSCGSQHPLGVNLRREAIVRARLLIPKLQPRTSVLALRIRAEQQALAKWGLNYVIDEYLSRKIANPSGFLP
jgi:hypothetical protein